MLESLLTNLKHLNQDLAQLEQRLEDVDFERFNKAPGPDKWSASQIMHHLMRAEELSLKYCQKKLSFQPQLANAGVVTKVRSLVVHYCMKLPLRFEAPHGMGTEFLPTEDHPHQTFSIWKQHRKNWADFFQELPPEYLQKAVYKHPVGGRLSWVGMLRFFKSHYDHHYPQIERAVQL